MRQFTGNSLQRIGIFFAFVLGTISRSAYAGQLSISHTATCPSRTVNYITHVLPQQCLRSSWSSTGVQTPSPNPTIETTGANQARRDNPSATTEAVAQEPSSRGQDKERITTDSKSTTTSTDLLTSTSASQRSHETARANSIIPPPTPPHVEFDAESPLGNADFLSFEQWKRQNLAKTGQSADHVGNRRKEQEDTEQRRRPAGINNALDAVGDDAEIDLSFGGFAAEIPADTEPTTWGRQVDKGQDAESTAQAEEGHTPGRQSRSNDAGTTCKERFNYASFDCAATILKTNPQCSGSSSVLVENKDSYMLNECSANNKFLILELCDDIAIDTIVLANFEFFSSIFRTVRVSVSDRYPVKMDKWLTLGTYEARNSREVQAFLVENPLIWARYLRIEFLTYYGKEFYCPLSLIRVHGTTMMEDYKHDGESSKADEDSEDDLDETVKNGERMQMEAVADTIIQERIGDAHANVLEIQASPSAQTDVAFDQVASEEVLESLIGVSEFNKSADELAQVAALFNTSGTVCPASPNSVLPYSSQPAPPPTHSPDLSLTNCSTGGRSLPTITEGNTTRDNSTGGASKSSSTSTRVTLDNSPPANVTQGSSTDTQSPSGAAPLKPPISNSTVSDQVKVSTTSTQPSPANPTIQESFFKSVQKRLSQLESNSTLSLQYIEEQSRLLRTAFSAVEKRQLAKTTSFLETLNTTVLSELRQFRQQYDQIWQSTVIELESQREQYQHEVLAMNARLGILAQELVFQKRMSILQSVLVLLCLGLVLFSRSALNSYLELPILQNVITRSQSFRSSSPTLETPSASPSSTRPSSAYAEKRHFGILKKGRHNRQDSDVVRDDRDPGREGPIIAHPEPASTSDSDDGEESNNDSDVQDTDHPRVESPTPDAGGRPRSSPPVLPSTLRSLQPEPRMSTHTWHRTAATDRLLSPLDAEDLFQYPINAGGEDAQDNRPF